MANVLNIPPMAAVPEGAFAPSLTSLPATGGAVSPDTGGVSSELSDVFLPVQEIDAMADLRATDPAAADILEGKTAAEQPPEQALPDDAGVRAGIERLLRSGASPDQIKSLLGQVSALRGMSRDQKGMLGRFQQAGERAKLAQAQMSEARQAQAEFRQQAADEAVKAEVEYENRLQTVHSLRDSAILQGQSRLDAAMQDFNSRAAAIDKPNYGFALAQSISALGNAIGMGMGAAAGILAGTGGNPVAPVAQQMTAVLNSIIERDIRAQRLGLDASKQRIGIARNALADMRMHFKDRQQAEDALRLAQWRRVKTQLASNLAGTQVMMEQGLLQDAIYRVEQKEVELEAGIRNTEFQQNLGILDKQIRIAELQKQDERFRFQMGAQAADAQPTVISVGGRKEFGQVVFRRAVPGAESKVIREVASGLGAILPQADRTIAYIESLTRLGRKFDPRSQQMLGSLMTLMRSVDDAGKAFTEGEMELALQQLTGGYPLDKWFTLTADPASSLREFKSNLIDRMRAKFTAYGGDWSYEDPTPRATQSNVAADEAYFKSRGANGGW